MLFKKTAEQKSEAIEKKMKKALSAQNNAQAMNAFASGLVFFNKEKMFDDMAKMMRVYLPQITDTSALKNTVLSIEAQDAATGLDDHGYTAEALVLLDAFDIKEMAFLLLSKHGRSEEIVSRLHKLPNLSRDDIDIAIRCWENENGDFRNSPPISAMIKSVGLSNKDALPNDPRVKEYAGYLKEAACAYEKSGKADDAARCYEAIGNYTKAYSLYIEIHNNEGISRAAEKLGNYEEALQFVQNPGRKIDLLVLLNRFEEALKFASNYSDFDTLAEKIRKKAFDQISQYVARDEYVKAMELVAISKCGDDERNSVLSRGRLYYAEQAKFASDAKALQTVYENIIRLEELAGNYEEAAHMAEDFLRDFERASALYEKANLYNQAIETIMGNRGEDAMRRAAELHEKGGNILSAAQIFEKIGEYADAARLYDSLSNYAKAAECYAKSENIDSGYLASLYEKSGEYEKAIAIYMESGNITDLEKAKTIAHGHGLSTHENAIENELSRLIKGNEADVIKCLKKAESSVLSTYSMCLGIDYGTTNSVGAIYNKISKKVEIIPLPGEQGKYYLPSYFGLDENNKPIVGERARSRSIIFPRSVVSRIKRSLGQGNTYLLGKRNYKAEELSALIIKSIKENAEAYLSVKIRDEFMRQLDKNGIRYPEEMLNELIKNNSQKIEITSVVLTVPAFYNDNQKRATRDAADVAGLTVKRLLHEPTAAALAYGYQRNYSGNLVVIDLGGGTLDLSLLEIGDGVYEVIDVFGDTKLGGSDIDSAILEYACRYLKEKYGIQLSQEADEASLNRLRDACENLKINLSGISSSTIELYHFCGLPVFEMPLSRAELENISAEVLKRFKQKLEIFAKQVAKEKGSADHFLLVGNASKMPAIIQIANEVFGNIALAGLDSGTVVANGAAIEAAVLSSDIEQTLLLDVVPFCLGIAVKSKIGDTGEEISRLIERNTTIPTKKSEIYTTTEDNQNEVSIRVYQGERIKPEDNYFLGRFSLGGIPPAKKGEPQIEVTFDIGPDCILSVTAKDIATGKQNSIRIDGAVSMSPAEKGKLKGYYAEIKKIDAAEDDIEEIKRRIESIQITINKTVEYTKKAFAEFEDLFNEKVLGNAKNYTASAETGMLIQNMFLLREQLPADFQRIIDRINSLNASLKQHATSTIDYSGQSAVHMIQDQKEALQIICNGLKESLDHLQNEMLDVVNGWNLALRNMQPDFSKMSALEAASSHIASGQYSKAREYLEAIAHSPEGLSKKAFDLLLLCCNRMGQREKYKDIHKNYGYLFGLIYPDFNRLDSYLNKINDSIVMIIASSDNGDASGSGFAIANRTIATNRHVVAGSSAERIRIIGMNKNSRVTSVEMDPVADLAILHVEEDYTPLRIGEFNFVSPGEQVIAIGFPSPTSADYKENIYISKGIVNSIRRIKYQPERVIFIDAKIGSGMSGGPLINDLGEVIGINTMTQYRIKDAGDNNHSEKVTENQNIAISTHFLERYQ